MQIGDTTGKGNSCDTTDDPVGCIFTQNLLVEDVTAAEITAAVAGVAAASNSTSAATTTAVAALGTSIPSSTAASACLAQSITTVTAGAASNTSAASASSATTATASGTNVQTFSGALGGISAPAVIQSTGTRPFSVEGDTFVNSAAALQRSCSIQHNQCADAANAETLAGGVSQCDTQNTACNAASTATKKTKRALNFGSCSNPAIEFAAGLDGRTQDAFIAVNQKDFSHGSALNIGVVASFICQRFSSPCDAGSDAVAACTTAQAAASAAGGTTQAAADAWNAALGVIVSGASNGTITAVAATTGAVAACAA